MEKWQRKEQTLKKVTKNFFITEFRPGKARNSY